MLTENPASMVSVYEGSASVSSCAYRTSRRFHPGYSLLGCWLRRRTDRRHAEALHILLLTGLALFLLLTHYLSGALLHEGFAAPPSGAWIYWLSQAGCVGIALATCVIGFRPALTVTCTARALHLEQGDRSLAVPYTTLTSIQRISAQRFHRHERRYAATRVFIGELRDAVLLLHTAQDGPVALALPTSDLEALQEHLETARTSTRTESTSVNGREGELESG